MDTKKSTKPASTARTADRLIFFGTDDFSAPTLKALLADGFNMVAVVTKPDALVGRGRILTPPTIKTIAQAAGLPVFQPTKLSEITDELAAMRPDAGVVVAYGKIIPQRVIDLFPKGLINVHTSLLPKYRGASPIEAAIVNGDAETGVSIMRINAGMDAGPIYSQTRLPLAGTETRPELYEKLSRLGASELIRVLPNILSGHLMPVPQDDATATYVKLIQKTDGNIDWSLPAEIIERQIRGYLGWPGSRTALYGTEVIITAAHVAGDGENLAKQLTTTAGENGVLVIDHLKPAGKREMTGQEFLAGRASRYSISV